MLKEYQQMLRNPGFSNAEQYPLPGSMEQVLVSYK